MASHSDGQTCGKYGLTIVFSAPGDESIVTKLPKKNTHKPCVSHNQYCGEKITFGVLGLPTKVKEPSAVDRAQSPDYLEKSLKNSRNCNMSQ